MKRFLVVALVLLLYGCPGMSDISVSRDYTPAPKTVTFLWYLKSYKLGTPTTVTVGNPIINWQERTYTTRNINQRKFIAKNDFDLQGKYEKSGKPLGSNIHVYANKGDEFFTVGITDINGKEYFVIGQNKHTNKYYLLIDRNGVLNKNILVHERLSNKLMCDDVISSPEEISFTETPNVERTMVNGMSREVIFGGINNISLNATYREFTPDNMARPAFTQEIVYLSSAESIRFRDFKIKVHEISGDQITFTVIEDGLPNQEPIAE